MLCATPFLERIQTCERECEDGTKAVLQFTEKEFGSMLTLRSPIVASQSHDEVIQMRTMNTATEQDIALKELEIQALRTAILRKHADLVRIKDEKAIKVNHADSLLRGMNRNTYLPVEVILRIFELLYHPQSVDFKIRSTRELSLYKIATGFEDLPGWRKAIMSQIPLVLAPDSGQWDNVKNELSLRNKIAIGYRPRVCAYDDNDVVAQTGIREPAAAYLAINSGYFYAHLDRARHFELKSVIFSASDLQKLSEGLDYAGELLWRVESLEIVLSRSYTEIHDQFWTQLGGQDNRGPFRLSIPPGDLAPRLRIACLPWGSLQGCLPLLTEVTSLEIVIPEETDAIAVNNILVSLHSLPQSITHLTLRRVYSRDETPIFDDVDNNPAFLPNLVELAVKGFESRMANVLIKGIDSPNLASLSAKLDISTREMMGDFQNDMPRAKAKMDQLQSDFLELAHKKFPRLRRLNYTPPESAFRLGTHFLLHLSKPDAVEGASGERGWLLPMLEVLDFNYDGENMLDIVTSLAAARLKSNEVSALRSVTLPSLDHRARRVRREVADIWRDTQLNALRILVPDVVITSGLALNA